MNKPHKFCIYPPEPRTEVSCLRLNFNISKLVYLNNIIATVSLISISSVKKKFAANVLKLDLNSAR